MVKVHLLRLGAYQTNCYIFYEEGYPRCCVVDPGYEPETILEALDELGLTLEAILLTHGHHDHVGAVRQLAADTGCKVYLHAADLSLPPQITAGALYHTDSYDEGDTLHLAGTEISVLHTPGHTPGCVCLRCGEILFTGDTLFAGSCGRTDLPGGSWETIHTSLRRLAAMEEDLWVLPGHSETSTLKSEQKHNPYMR